ncbi:MAG: membrane protein [Candidatus Neomarinimicrobiota bacterium]|nr:MAG: membrane protein [Candidatus Neomarinimicrobiota bacterium]
MGLEFYSIYNWVKILHISFVVAWMAGLLYLPRLFVYHKENENENKTVAIFKVMEKRLYFYIMNPAAVLVWFSGIYLGHVLGFDTWLIVKIGVVLIMTAYHILLGIHLNDFKLDKQIRTSRYFRIINEVPFFLLFIILIMVIMKPFY